VRAETDARQEHLHLLGTGVLRLVKNDKGFVQRTAAHEGEWRNFDNIAFDQALAAAGTDAALETADIALMADELLKIPFAIRLGRSTLRNIRMNVTLSLGLKAAFLALAVVGAATLWMAVVADMGASLLVIANGLRLLRAD
jgi:hypothetical protein